MRVTSIGHAGLHIETAHGAILCDPWFSPCLLRLLVPVPRQRRPRHGTSRALGVPLRVPPAPRPLRPRVAGAVTWTRTRRSCCPTTGSVTCGTRLTGLGFHRFIATKNAEPFEHDGLTLMIVAMTAPNDGPLGDSCLAVDDGTAAFLNQNDCRPTDLEPIVQFGQYDGHSLQYSGAIWFPDGLRPSRACEARARRAQARQRPRPCAAVRRGCRCPVGAAELRAAGVPRRRPLRDQRLRAEGKRLPRPAGLPRLPRIDGRSTTGSSCRPVRPSTLDREAGDAEVYAPWLRGGDALPVHAQARVPHRVRGSHEGRSRGAQADVGLDQRSAAAADQGSGGSR